MQDQHQVGGRSPVETKTSIVSPNTIKANFWVALVFTSKLYCAIKIMSVNLNTLKWHPSASLVFSHFLIQPILGSLHNIEKGEISQIDISKIIMFSKPPGNIFV